MINYFSATIATVIIAVIMAVSGEFFEVREDLNMFNASNIPENTTTVLYYHVSIPVLTSDENFSHLKELTNLTFWGTNTTLVESGAFQDLQNLMILRLRRNGMMELLPGVFKGLDAIDFIDLQGNKLNESALDPDIWTTVNDTLSNLRLAQNSFTHLTPNMFINFGNLKVLNLYHNNISVMDPGAFNGLKSLDLLHLGFNAISSLDSGVFKGLSSLTRLQIWGNYFTVVQTRTFVDLASLELLSIGPSRYIEVFEPNSLQGLKSLKILSLQGSIYLETVEWSVFDPTDINVTGKCYFFHRFKFWSAQS